MKKRKKIVASESALISAKNKHVFITLNVRFWWIKDSQTVHRIDVRSLVLMTRRRWSDTKFHNWNKRNARPHEILSISMVLIRNSICSMANALSKEKRMSLYAFDSFAFFVICQRIDYDSFSKEELILFVPLFVLLYYLEWPSTWDLHL